jgi:sugar lactone lactonase YvrE
VGTIRGEVTLVEFDPNRHWFTAVRLRQSPDGAEEWYQIDGGTFAVDGVAVDRAGLLKWLAEWAGETRAVRVVLTGGFGAYPTRESAEFYSETVK